MAINQPDKGRYIDPTKDLKKKSDVINIIRKFCENSADSSKNTQDVKYICLDCDGDICGIDHEDNNTYGCCNCQTLFWRRVAELIPPSEFKNMVALDIFGHDKYYERLDFRRFNVDGNNESVRRVAREAIMKEYYQMGIEGKDRFGEARLGHK